MNNTQIWDAVCETNPDDTKKVSQRGGFTAIDAYSQIRAATAQFGPVGKGWGWIVESCQDYGGGALTVMIQFWWRDGDEGVMKYNTFGSAKYERDPDEAAKKALTDAITKALSYLGFNADVFLGKFDDSKYVEKQQAKAKEADKQVKMQEWINSFLDKYEYFKGEQRELLVKESEKALGRLTPELRDQVDAAMSKINAEEEA